MAGAWLLPGFQANPGQTKPTNASNPQSGAPAEKPPEQTASIDGTVVDAKLGKPVKDVTLLAALATGGGTPASTKTDETGHFQLKNLTAGSYLLIADHPRYARQTYGSRNGLLGGTPLTLTIGRELKELTFKIQPNAVASGRVLDEDGEPMAGVLVAALKGLYAKGKRQYLPLGTAMTNDLGEYRIANMAAGRYLISATKMNQTAANTKPPAETPAKTPEGEPEKTYVTTYYPNAMEATGAAPVEVTAGGDVGGMDIRMARAKSVRLKGKVVGVPGDQQVTARLIPKDAGVIAMITGRSAPVKKTDGTFEIVGVTPGSYTLRVSDQTGMKPMGAGIQVQVGDMPVESMTIEVTSSAELAGSVVVSRNVPRNESQNEPKNDQPSLKGARVILESVEGLVIIPPNTTVAEDGTFTLKDVAPDKYFVRLMNGPPGAFVESAKFGTQAMGDQGLDLGGTAPGKIEIKLNPGGAQVDGVVRGQDDNPMSGVTVALIPDSKKYLLYQTQFTDQNGAFSFKTITPGDYKVLAWEEVEPNAFQDPEFVKPFLGKAEAVSLKESDHKGVSMKAIPR
jgi:protocatechuate 3,4-dioxygenase beta subunit